MLFNMFFK